MIFDWYGWYGIHLNSVARNNNLSVFLWLLVLKCFPVQLRNFYTHTYTHTGYQGSFIFSVIFPARCCIPIKLIQVSFPFRNGLSASFSQQYICTFQICDFILIGCSWPYLCNNMKNFRYEYGIFSYAVKAMFSANLS